MKNTHYLKGLIVIILLILFQYSCKEENINLINKKFSLLVSSEQLETLTNKKVSINVESPDFDKKNKDKIETYFEIEKGEGIILVSDKPVKENEVFNHKYDEINNFTFNYQPTKKGDHKIIVTAKSEIFSCSDTIIIHSKDTETFYQISGVPDFVYVDKNFSYIINLLETNEENLLVSAKFIKGKGNITLGENIFENLELSKGINEVSVLPLSIGNNQIEISFKGDYGKDVKDTILFEVKSYEWFYSLPETEKIEYDKAFSFNLSLTVPEENSSNAFKAKIRYLNNVVGTLSANGNSVNANNEFEIKKGNNVFILTPKSLGYFEVEFIVADKYGLEKKDTAKFVIKEIINPIKINVSPLSQSIIIGNQANINVSVNEDNYNDTFEFIYELVSGNGNFSGNASQTISSGTHNFSFTPIEVGINTFRLTVKDKNNQTTEQVVTVIADPAALPPIKLTVTPLSQNVAIGDQANLMVSISEENYSESFEFSYSLITGNGYFSGNDKQTVSSGTHSYSFTPSDVGTNTFRLSVTDKNNQTTNQVVTVISLHSELNAQVNLNNIDCEVNKETDYILNVSEKNYAGVFNLSYSLSNGSGDVYVNRSLLGPNLKKEIPSGSNTIKFIPTNIGRNIKKMLTISDTRGQSKNIDVIFNSFAKISVSAEAGGTVSGNTNIYIPNQTTTVSAIPSTGYEFSGWYENNSLVSQSRNYSFSVSKSRNLIAQFKKQMFTVTLNTAQGGNVTGGGSYEYLSKVSVNAIPMTRYKFTGWYENGNKVSSTENYSFTINKNRSLNATFEMDCLDIYTFRFGNTLAVDNHTSTNGGFKFVSYQWFNGDTDMAISGETNQSILLKSKGNYYCKCVTDNGLTKYTCNFYFTPS